MKATNNTAYSDALKISVNEVGWIIKIMDISEKSYWDCRKWDFATKRMIFRNSVTCFRWKLNLKSVDLERSNKNWRRNCKDCRKCLMPPHPLENYKIKRYFENKRY